MLALRPYGTLRDIMVHRGLILGYGAVAYLAFLGVLVYTVGFLANAVVPKGIDDGHPARSRWPCLSMPVF